MPQFIHLHNHSDFSLLDGAIKVEWYAERAQQLGMSHIGLTDHGALFGAIRFEKACRSHGVKPIIGCEIYVAVGSRFDRPQDGRKFHHLVLYCRNEQGYANLVQLVSKGYTEGFYYKPRVDDELLARYSEGLMASTACLAGEIPSLLLSGQSERAQQRACFYRDVFGSDNFWLEVMNHGLEDELLVRDRMKLLSRKTGIPLLATNDIHYLEPQHAEAHHILCCIGDNRSISEARRSKIDHPEYYFKTAQQMEQLFADMPEALENTLALAQRCDLRIPQPGPVLPEYEVPVSFESKEGYFRHLVRQGIAQRYGEEPQQEVLQRMEVEVQVICSLSFVGYFLIVWDFIKWARDRGIAVGPGRGSGAGSIVAYALGITDVEPLKYNLLFERFLNSERVSMPDFDIDFCFERRGEVIDYVTQRYGGERVAGICTLGTLKTKAVLKDVARVLEIPFNEANLLTSLVPEGPKMSVTAALHAEAKLKEYYDKDPTYRKLFEVAAVLEGMNRHVSTHACGMVIGPSAVTDYVPLYKDAKTGAISTQYTMDLIEDCGLVKMDFLGLKTLTLLERLERLVRQRYPDFSLAQIPEDDAPTFAMLARGDSSAVFQFESEGMQRILRQTKPDSIEDLIALNALYRPGPLQFIDQFAASKSGKKPIAYPHPDLEVVLRPTYGVIVYQEQVMEIARIIGGFSLGKADILRRAMGKKKESEMEQMKGEFVSGALARGYSESKAVEIFELLKPFAGYGFNKSHAAAYSLLAYKTAYFRANYIVEFMAANLTNEIGSPNTFKRYLDEIRELAIVLLPPSINDSQHVFSVLDNKIIYGLAGVKGIGQAAVDEVLQSRSRRGPFTSFLDFLEKVPLKSLNKKAIEALIQAGVFDRVEQHNRATLLHNLDRVLPMVSKSKESQRGISLFAGMEEEIRAEIKLEEQADLHPHARLEMEKEVTGFYLSGHPLDEYREFWQRSSTLNLGQLGKVAHGQSFLIVGLLKQLRIITTRREEKMFIATMEDFNGSIEVVAFPRVYAVVAPLLGEGQVLALRGEIEAPGGDERVKFRIREAFAPQQAPISGDNEVHIELGKLDYQEDNLLALRDLLQRFPGPLAVILHLQKGGRRYRVRVSRQLGLRADLNLLHQLPPLSPPGADITRVWLSSTKFEAKPSWSAGGDPAPAKGGAALPGVSLQTAGAAS